MDDKVVAEQARAITKLLADLDLLFSVSKDSQGQLVWNLVPFGDDVAGSGGVDVVVAFRENFLHVFHLSEIDTIPESDKLLHLLKLNTRLAAAKVGIVEEPNFPRGLWVGVQIPPQVVNAEILKLAIGAVVVGAREARKILAPPGS